MDARRTTIAGGPSKAWSGWRARRLTCLFLAGQSAIAWVTGCALVVEGGRAVEAITLFCLAALLLRDSLLSNHTAPPSTHHNN